MGRGLSRNRRNRIRHIKRRLRILRDVWGQRDVYYPEGYLDKFNLVCSCHRCRKPKYREKRTTFKQALINDLESFAPFDIDSDFS